MGDAIRALTAILCAVAIVAGAFMIHPGLGLIVGGLLIIYILFGE